MAVTFEKSMADWIAKVGEKAKKLVQEVPQELSMQIIMNTPVKTGFLRGSWFPSINDPDKASEGARDPSGGTTIASIAFTATQMLPGDTFYLMNSAKYALRVEFGFVGEDSLGRNYNQAGRAFVRSALEDFDQIVERVARRLNG